MGFGIFKAVIQESNKKKGTGFGIRIVNGNGHWDYGINRIDGRKMGEHGGIDNPYSLGALVFGC